MTRGILERTPEALSRGIEVPPGLPTRAVRSCTIRDGSAGRTSGPRHLILAVATSWCARKSGHFLSRLLMTQATESDDSRHWGEFDETLASQVLIFCPNRV